MHLDCRNSVSRSTIEICVRSINCTHLYDKKVERETCHTGM